MIGVPVYGGSVAVAAIVAQEATGTSVLPTEVWVALIVSVSSMLTLIIQGWQRRADKRETDGRLTEIHTLVNSNMTTSKQAELSATKRELVLMKRALARDKVDGLAIGDEDKAAIKLTEARVAELTAELDERLSAQTTADAQRLDAKAT